LYLIFCKITGRSHALLHLGYLYSTLSLFFRFALFFEGAIKPKNGEMEKQSPIWGGWLCSTLLGQGFGFHLAISPKKLIRVIYQELFCQEIDLLLTPRDDSAMPCAHCPLNLLVE
jgi:hypothetical protein